MYDNYEDKLGSKEAVLFMGVNMACILNLLAASRYTVLWLEMLEKNGNICQDMR